MGVKCDFSGWATCNDLQCTDGRIIRKDAFKDNDGKEVPLIWNHRHDDPRYTLGHALLENRDTGVYAYCFFNNSETGKSAREAVLHGDITRLSIFANQLKQQGANVNHGNIREVSLVLAGANPGAFIDSVIRHSADFNDDDEGIFIYEGKEIELSHSDENEKNPEPDEKAKTENSDEPKSKDEETLQDVFDTLNEKQKNVVYAMIAQALQTASTKKEDDKNEEDNNVKHNVFDNESNTENTLSHSEVAAIFTDAQKSNSLKDTVLAHGIEEIESLFPDARNLNTPPKFIGRDTGWVGRVMNSVHHTPFSRVKSTFADITADEARARGYVKGNIKLEEVFTLLKRSTEPTTVYKKQKLHRDDVVDITDFDVVGWIKSEMRTMLDEELARAFLVGDGRSTSSDDKIDEQKIRPIWTDSDLFTIKKVVNTKENMTSDEKARLVIRASVKARKDYKGSGNPVLFTTEDWLTDMLLVEDTNQHRLYKTETELAQAMRVKEIITVPVFEGLSRVDTDGKTRKLIGIIVNLSDYNVGADKGGNINMFDDFDINYNAQLYLIETRCSGALTEPYSAVALEEIEEPAG